MWDCKSSKMNAKVAIYLVLLVGAAIGARALADDAGGEKPDIAVKWDVSGFKKQDISISLKNNGGQPVQFRKYLDVKYVEEGENIEKLVANWPLGYKEEIAPLIVLVSRKESEISKYQSMGPHVEGAPLEIAAKSSKVIKPWLDEDYVPSFTEADEMLLLLVKDGKILQTVTMKKQHGVWKVAD
jgi:hypothetical protein